MTSAVQYFFLCLKQKSELFILRRQKIRMFSRSKTFTFKAVVNETNALYYRLLPVWGTAKTPTLAELTFRKSRPIPNADAFITCIILAFLLRGGLLYSSRGPEVLQFFSRGSKTKMRSMSIVDYILEEVLDGIGIFSHSCATYWALKTMQVKYNIFVNLSFYKERLD